MPTFPPPPPRYDLGLTLDAVERHLPAEQAIILRTALRNLAAHLETNWCVDEHEIAEFIETAAVGKL